jgi:hypothetical protein
VSFAAITLCVASQRVFIAVSVYFVIDSVQKLLGTPSYKAHSCTLTRCLIILFGVTFLLWNGRRYSGCDAEFSVSYYSLSLSVHVRHNTVSTDYVPNRCSSANSHSRTNKTPAGFPQAVPSPLNTPLLEDPFLNYRLIYTYVTHAASSLEVSWPKFFTNFSLPHAPYMFHPSHSPSLNKK